MCRFELMPNDAGLLLYPPCVQVHVFKAFVREMVDCLGKTYWTPPSDAKNPEEFGIASWYEGRSEALLAKAIDVYASHDPNERIPKLRLKMRTLHHDFGHCDECDEIQAERADMVSNRMGPDALAQNSARAAKHARLYVGERRALENLRLSSARSEVRLPYLAAPFVQTLRESGALWGGELGTLEATRRGSTRQGEGSDVSPTPPHLTHPPHPAGALLHA